MPLLDSQETTSRNPLPFAYRDYRREKCSEQYDAAVRLYKRLDDRDGKTRFNRLDECRTQAYFVRHVDTGKVRVRSQHCRLRWCPLCIIGLKYYRMEQVAEWLRKASHPKFLTFTLKHVSDDLYSQIVRLYSAFNIIRKRKFFSSRVTGGVWFFQVKKGKNDGLWHPHLHCVIAGNYIPQRLLSRHWHDITGTSHIVDIRAVQDPNKVADYVARYSSEPADLSYYSTDEAIELYDALHGRRLCGTWGNAKSIQLKPPRDPEPEKWKNIGSWAVITQTHQYCEAAQLIIAAWQSDSVLPADVSCRNIDNFIDDVPDWVNSDIPPPDSYEANLLF